MTSKSVCDRMNEIGMPSPDEHPRIAACFQEFLEGKYCLVLIKRPAGWTDFSFGRLLPDSFWEKFKS